MALAPRPLNFNNSGATPFQPTVAGPTLPGSTPRSKALSNIQLGSGFNTQTNTSTPGYNSGGYNLIGSFMAGKPTYNPIIKSSPALSTTTGSTSGLLPPTNQPVKSHTITNVDGSTTSQTYHPPVTATTPTAPTKPSAPANAPLSSATGGLLNIGSGGASGNVNTATTNLNNIANNQGNSAQSGTPAAQVNDATKGLLNLETNPSPEVVKANADLANFQKQSPFLLSDVKNNPNVAAEVSVGRGQALGQTLTAENQALATAQQNALAEQGQQITAGNEAGTLANATQGQQITSNTNAGTLGVNQQNTQNSALTSAGNLSQPVTGPGGVLGTPQSVGAFGSGSNTTFGGGQAQGTVEAGKQAVAMNNANTAAKGIQGTIQQYLQANPQLNSSVSTIANAAQQWIQGKQLGDPAYQTLFNYLNEYVSTLAPILGVGGDTTNLKTEIAQSFVNAKASGQSISEVLNNIGKLADDKYANFVSAAQGGGQVAGGTPTGSTPTSFSTEW